MKKIGLLVKEVSEKKIKSSIKDTEAFFIIGYSGISSPDMCSLRMSLKAANASMVVAKNSVVRRALKDSGLDGALKAIEGPCGIIFAKEEPVGTSKVLYKFYKDHEKLRLAGAVLKDKILEKKDIETLAALPSKEVLRAQVVMALNSPISGLVITLNQVLAKFVICLDQIKQKKTNQ